MERISHLYHALSRASETVSWSTALSYILISLATLICSTRILSARSAVSKASGEHGAKPVPAVPYWLPVLGHLPNMIIDAEGFMQRLRQTYSEGAFALNFGGTTHNIFYTPGLATALMNEKVDKADSEEVADGMLHTVFGFPKGDMARYRPARPEIVACYRLMLSEPGLGDWIAQAVKKIAENVRDFVSFSTSPVDQTLWERSSDVKLAVNAAGQEVMEASLLPLVRGFCACTAQPTLLGSDFLHNFPESYEQLWELDRGFLLLALGMPRWLPIPMLTRAHIARRRLLQSLCAFHEAMERNASDQDPGVDWCNLHDVGTFVQVRTKIFRKYNWSIRARAATDLALMWAANVNSNTLIFWMLNRIYADTNLLSRIRDEIAPYARAVQPKQDLAIAESARLDAFDVDSLCSNCPLLKSCYIECLRVDTASWSPKIVQQDFSIQSRDKIAQGWSLKKGAYVHAAHDLHNTDPKYFPEPKLWKADRHVRHSKEGEAETAEMGSIRPYGTHTHS